MTTFRQVQMVRSIARYTALAGPACLNNTHRSGEGDPMS